MPGESPMNLPGVSNRFCLCNLGSSDVSQNRTFRFRTTRNAVIHSILFASSSGLARANHSQKTVRATLVPRLMQLRRRSCASNISTRLRDTDANLLVWLRGPV
jgi:hypothetical protein